MFSFSWWMFLNKCANFLMLFAVCWYFVRKYLSPWARKALEERVSSLNALQEEALDLAKKRVATAEAFEAQEAYAASLLVKIQVWKAAMEVKDHNYKVQEELQEKRCHEYLQRRADGLCQERLKQEMLPRVYEQTREQVITFFKNKEEHVRYVKQLVAGLPKGKTHG